METATLAGGCFWCTEAVFNRLKGVDSVISGFTGGTIDNPSSDEVYSGRTGHAEAIQVTFNPQIISYGKILEVFFKTHDPTSLNRQGADVGSQYRSAVFYHDAIQEKTAKEIKEKITADLTGPVVTEIVPFGKFFPAESYHQDFYGRNRQAPYCRLVIDPKIIKLERSFPEEIVK